MTTTRPNMLYLTTLSDTGISQAVAYRKTGTAPEILYWCPADVDANLTIKRLHRNRRFETERECQDNIAGRDTKGVWIEGA